jgi:hypothetical protein
MPNRTILVTSVDIEPAASEEFNRWYEERHLPDILACPGFVSCTRFECVGEREPRYLAIYELESEDALTTPEMQRVRGWGDQFPVVKNFHERIYRAIHEAP